MAQGASVLQNVLGYCSKTTIHGFAYLANKSIHPIGKLFWAIVIILGIGYYL